MQPCSKAKQLLVLWLCPGALIGSSQWLVVNTYIIKLICALRSSNGFTSWRFRWLKIGHHFFDMGGGSFEYFCCFLYIRYQMTKVNPTSCTYCTWRCEDDHTRAAHQLYPCSVAKLVTMLTVGGNNPVSLSLQWWMFPSGRSLGWAQVRVITHSSGTAEWPPPGAGNHHAHTLLFKHHACTVNVWTYPAKKSVSFSVHTNLKLLVTASKE